MSTAEPEFVFKRAEGTNSQKTNRLLIRLFYLKFAEKPGQIAEPPKPSKKRNVRKETWSHVICRLTLKIATYVTCNNYQLLGFLWVTATVPSVTKRNWAVCITGLSGNANEMLSTDWNLLTWLHYLLHCKQYTVEEVDLQWRYFYFQCLFYPKIIIFTILFLYEGLF